MADHHHLSLNALSLCRIPNTDRLTIELKGSFGLDGFGELDARSINISFQTEVDFQGIIAVPESFEPKLTTALEASQIAESYIYVNDFSKPKWDRFRFIFEPNEAAV